MKRTRPARKPATSSSLAALRHAVIVFARRERVVRKPQTREAPQVGLLKRQPRIFDQRQRLQMRHRQPLRIRERVRHGIAMSGIAISAITEPSIISTIE